MKYSLTFLLDPASEAVTEKPNVLVVNALLFYEGEHTDMYGRTETFDYVSLSKIVQETNDWLVTGHRIKLYSGQIDHSISQKSVIGYIDFNELITLETIKEVPEGVSKDLIGKLGIFGKITIAGAENIEQYRDKRLRELSIGLTTNFQILEISAVSIPALPGAALYGLSLVDTLSSSLIREKVNECYELFEAFITTLYDISYASLTMEECQKLWLSSYQDFIKILDKIFLTPMIGDSGMTTEEMQAEIARITAENEALKSKATLYSKAAKFNSEWQELRTVSEALVSGGRMSPDELNEMFTSDFSGLNGTEPEDQILKFGNRIEHTKFMIGILSKRQGIIQGMLPGRPLETDEKSKETAKLFAKSVITEYGIPRTYS